MYVLVAEVIAHENYALCLRFSADGSELYSAGMDRYIKRWSFPELTLPAGGRCPR